MNTHGIKVATTLTGLSAHVIRVWEKRYAAVTPKRTETNRRLYSDADISRLQTLSHLIKKGHTISHIANLNDDELHDLVNSIEHTEQNPHQAEAEEHSSQFVATATEAIRNYDQKALESIFDEATLTLGYSGLLELVIIPVVHQVGDDWHNGVLTIAGEHAATSFIKDYLSHSVRSFSLHENAPVLVITTPAGQLHDLGAFIGSCQARKLGWKIVNLGASIPAAEIAGALLRVNATALLLGIVYPLDDPQLDGELKRLRKLAPAKIPILVGGCNLDNYLKSLEEINAIPITEMSGLAPELHKIRETRLSTSPVYQQAKSI